MASITSITDLFIHELSDIYSAEKQLTRALPRLAHAASDAELSGAFQDHAEETQGQVDRIDRIVELLDIRLKRMKSVAMEGLIDEGRDMIDSIAKGPLRDAALIGGAQKVEHYEMAAYGTLCALARHLGYRDAIPLLEETLNEEKQTDKKLTAIAEQGGKNEAATGQPAKRTAT
ncbi:ferritin-like domain-containing protein [Dyella jiangningensis]|uniref:YciE/YciF ferroxidase family protein n=1 Tax=Dyella jiangningensis TaxID=1379159 RepID=UPI00241086C6|nr:ferritin-like domain-containing protein [Dyella jiangningensis]MDG2538879.1 ferritin-like domain-containing protein [Dyella jiangningensis]